jgi:hypothetical protein
MKFTRCRRAMPANHSPQYEAAEAEFRACRVVHENRSAPRAVAPPGSCAARVQTAGIRVGKPLAC